MLMDIHKASGKRIQPEKGRGEKMSCNFPKVKRKRNHSVSEGITPNPPLYRVISTVIQNDYLSHYVR